MPVPEACGESVAEPERRMTRSRSWLPQITGFQPRVAEHVELPGREPMLGDRPWTGEAACGSVVEGVGDWASAGAQLVLFRGDWTPVTESMVELELPRPGVVYLDFPGSNINNRALVLAEAELAWLNEDEGWRRAGVRGLRVRTAEGSCSGPGDVFFKQAAASETVVVRGFGRQDPPALLAAVELVERVLTVHTEPLEGEDGVVSVTCTGMSGDELASLRAGPGQDVAWLRARMESELLRSEGDESPLRFMRADGQLIRDDEKLVDVAL